MHVAGGPFQALKKASVRVTYGSPRQRPDTQEKKQSDSSDGFPCSTTPESSIDPRSGGSKHTPVNEASRGAVSKRRYATNSDIFSNSLSSSDESSDDDTEQQKCERKHKRPKKTLIQTSLFGGITKTSDTSTHLPSCLIDTKPVSKKQAAAGLAVQTTGDTPKREQTFLDFGQKLIAPDPCKQCGMAFQRGRKEDEELHAKFHRAWRRQQDKLLTWGPAKPGLQGNHDELSRICIVDPQDTPKRELQRALDILNIANDHLGAVKLQFDDLFIKQRKLFLHVSLQGTVEGCLLAEIIKSASRIAPQSDKSVVFSSDTSCPVVCGISRIWVAPKARRSGVAMRMLSAVRTHFIYGTQVPLDSIAFTQPTADGQALAERFFGRSDFLVYVED